MRALLLALTVAIAPFGTVSIVVAFDPFIQQPGIGVQPRANPPLEWLGAADSRQPSVRKTRTVADPLFENLRSAPEFTPLVIN